MTTNSKALILKLTALRDHLKNCGVGSHGFERGNTCGRTGAGNSSEGSERRRNAGKRRKRKKGPGHTLPDRDRSKRRQQSGRNNANRRKFKDEVKAGKHGADGKALLKSQTAERKDLADTFRQTRKEDRQVAKQAGKDLRKEIKGERKEARKERSKEKVQLLKGHEKETAKLTKDHEKQHAKLDAKYESAKASTKNPEGLEANYKEKQSELSAAHKEEREGLAAEHKQARQDMAIEHREARVREREEFRDRVASQRDDDDTVRSQQHGDQHDQIADLRSSHRDERAQLKRDARDERDDTKAFEFVEIKASPGVDDGIPSAESILTNALVATGHSEAYAAGTLGDKESLELLHAVRLEARAWLRSEAQAVLDGLEEKALFGPIKAKVGAFFDRAKRGVREIIAAGLLAVAGPVLQHEVIAEEYKKQVSIQAEYLADFRKQIVAEAKPLDGTFVARAEQYGNAAWSGAQSIIRAASTKADIFDYELREHFGKDKPCKTCREQVDLEWQPIGTLKAIGESECMSGCHCSYLFKKGLDGEPHVAGRGPLWEAAFGRTG